MKSCKLSLLVVAGLILLVSCKNNDDSQDDLIPKEFHFLWEFVNNSQQESTFIKFEDDKVLIYMYEGENCFYKYTDALVSREGDKYIFKETDYEDEPTYAVYMKVENGELWVSGVRTFQTKEVFVKSQQEESSFTPLCTTVNKMTPQFRRSR